MVLEKVWAAVCRRTLFTAKAPASFPVYNADITTAQYYMFWMKQKNQSFMFDLGFFCKCLAYFVVLWDRDSVGELQSFQADIYLNTNQSDVSVVRQSASRQ